MTVFEKITNAEPWELAEAWTYSWTPCEYSEAMDAGWDGCENIVDWLCENTDVKAELTEAAELSPELVEEVLDDFYRYASNPRNEL